MRTCIRGHPCPQLRHSACLPLQFACASRQGTHAWHALSDSPGKQAVYQAWSEDAEKEARAGAGRGADQELKNQDGKSACEVAELNQQEAVVKQFEEYNAGASNAAER